MDSVKETVNDAVTEVTLSDIEDKIAHLSRADKVRLIDMLIRELSDMYPGIASDPDVLGGDARIGNTRIGVWMLVRMRQLGTSDAVILMNYPSLKAQDLVDAWAYADAHSEEIETAIYENETA